MPQYSYPILIMQSPKINGVINILKPILRHNTRKNILFSLACYYFLLFSARYCLNLFNIVYFCYLLNDCWFTIQIYFLFCLFLILLLAWEKLLFFHCALWYTFSLWKAIWIKFSLIRPVLNKNDLFFWVSINNNWFWHHIVLFKAVNSISFRTNFGRSLNSYRLSHTSNSFIFHFLAYEFPIYGFENSLQLLHPLIKLGFLLKS